MLTNRIGVDYRILKVAPQAPTIYDFTTIVISPVLGQLQHLLAETIDRGIIRRKDFFDRVYVEATHYILPRNIRQT